MQNGVQHNASASHLCVAWQALAPAVKALHAPGHAGDLFPQKGLQAIE